MLGARCSVLGARDDRVFDADMLEAALAVLDADQIGMELKDGPD